MRRLSSSVIAAAVLVALALCPVAARADNTTFDLTTAEFFNSSGQPISAGNGPYIQVMVDLTSPTTATITYTSLTDAQGYTYWMGDGLTAAVNVNANTFTVSNISDAYFSSCGYTQHPYCGNNSPPVGLDHLSSSLYNFWINNAGGINSGLVNTLSFTINDTSGTWNSAKDVLVSDSGPYDVGAHLIACYDSPNNPCASGINGYTAGLAPVPEPPVTVLLACSVLLFGGIFLRRPLFS